MNIKNRPLLCYGFPSVAEFVRHFPAVPARLCAALLLTLGSLPLGAADGVVDPVFDPAPSGTVLAPAVQPDGKIIVGGGFFFLNGVSRINMGRVEASGALEPNFHPSVNSEVYSAAVLGDGKIILAGTFDMVDGVVRNHLARLNSDGSLDNGFRPVVGRFVFCTLVQPDGKLVIGGTFTNVAGITRNRIARINPDGTLDLGFNPDANRISVRSLSWQPDGKIIVSGSFTNVGGLSRNRIARLNSDGTVDASFDPNADGIVYCSLVQPDGKIVIGGFFESVGGTARNRIARLHADGTLDTSFDPDASFTVNSLAQQADGKILLGGNFTTLGGVTHNYLGRLNSDGTVDATFLPNVGGQIDSVALQADGKIIVGGGFTNVGGLARSHLARLENSAATQTLSVFPSSNRVEWLRGGSSPETHHVTFDWSTNAGASWTTFGTGTRIAGGWEFSGVNLPVTGLVRARARTAGGIYSSSSSLLETVVEFDFAAPELGVEQPPGVELVDGTASLDFGNVVVGGSNSLVFTVTNSGTANLLLGDILKDGEHADDFIVGAPDLTTLPPGAITTFSVTFSPAAIGPRSAALHLASNDGDENPFDIALTGEGTVPPAPELGVQQPPGVELVDGTASLDFGSLNVGSSNSLVFTVTNSGTSDLLLGDILKDGEHAEDFIVGALDLTTLGPGASTTFSVTFSPAAAGPRRAALHLASNDGNENPFDIALTGAGIVPLDNLPPIVIDLVPSGVRLRFEAVRDRSYTIERTLMLDGPWIVLDTIIAPSDGLLEYVDTNAPAVSAFYRTRSP